MGLYDRIRDICQAKKLTIYDLEKAAGLKENSVYRWNRIRPSVDKVLSVAKVLGVTVEELAKTK